MKKSEIVDNKLDGLNSRLMRIESLELEKKERVESLKVIIKYGSMTTSALSGLILYFSSENKGMQALFIISFGITLVASIVLGEEKK